jgi:hypothetical protein
METEMDKNVLSSQVQSKGLRDRKIELALFLILGFLLGVMLKTEAGKRITIGFNDYLVTAERNEININQIQKDAIEKQKAQQKEQEEAIQKQQETAAQQDQNENIDANQEEQACQGDSCGE